MAESRTPARPLRVRSHASATGLGLSLVLFAAHACVRSGSLADVERGKEGRSWEDMSLAIAYALHGEFPMAFYEVRTDFFPREDPAFVSFRADLLQETAASGIRPWQFWRTIAVERFLARGPRYLAAVSDDAGRARLLGWAFRLLRGVSPFLLSWLAVLACLPVLAWVGWEFVDAGRAVAGIAFLGLLALSPYVVEMLQLPYSAAGFYLLGALALVAVAVYAALGRSVSLRGLLARVSLAAAAIGIAAFARQGTLFFLPAFVLSLARALGRVVDGRPRPRRAAALVAGAAALLAPFVALTLLTDRLCERTARAYGDSITVRHRPWFALWEGLGDFDRSKGYEWRDAAARRFLAEEGAGRLLGPRSERIFRAKLLHDLREDPLWYASILAKRVAATATQWKLRPWGPASGLSVAPSSSPNEGLVDAYYRLTTSADWIGIAERRVEVPLPLLWLPASVLVVSRIVRRDGGAGAAVARRGAVRALGLVALGVGTMPVAVSTASGLETQAFVLVYFLGLALLADELAASR